jgi:hypothetical protein
VLPEGLPNVVDIEMSVDEPVGLELTVVYFSLDFHLAWC